MTAPGDGGRYVVVTSGCLSGHGGKDKRLKVLRAEASADEIPTEHTEVYTAGNAPTQDHRLALVSSMLLQHCARTPSIRS